MAAQQQLLVLDDNMLRGMLQDQRFTAAIPCLASAKAGLSQLPRGGCARCKKRDAQRKAAGIIVQVRNCIATLPVSQRNALKQLTNARQIRVLRQNAQGAQVRVTF
jgi:hypothetical protein